jgi:hypothetical protein
MIMRHRRAALIRARRRRSDERPTPPTAVKKRAPAADRTRESNYSPPSRVQEPPCRYIFARVEPHS